MVSLLRHLSLENVTDTAIAGIANAARRTSLASLYEQAKAKGQTLSTERMSADSVRVHDIPYPDPFHLLRPGRRSVVERCGVVAVLSGGQREY